MITNADPILAASGYSQAHVPPYMPTSYSSPYAGGVAVVSSAGHLGRGLTSASGLENLLYSDSDIFGGDAVGDKVVDMLEIPGKGRCYVYFARYSYDPMTQSLNDNPESEIYLTAGDYILVWGEVDEDGFLEGELLDGRKGLVPMNFCER